MSDQQQQDLQGKEKIERRLSKATSLEKGPGKMFSRREDEGLQADELSPSAETGGYTASSWNRRSVLPGYHHHHDSAGTQSDRERGRGIKGRTAEEQVMVGGEEEEVRLANGEVRRQKEPGCCCLHVGSIEERKEENSVTSREKTDVKEKGRKSLREDEEEEELLAIREDMRRVESFFKCVGGKRDNREEHQAISRLSFLRSCSVEKQDFLSKYW